MVHFNRQATFGRVLLLLVTVAWGSSFVVLKDTLTTLGNGNFTFFILALRFLISGAILSAICYKKLISIKKDTLIKGLILGCVLFCAYGVQTVGLGFTAPSKNAFLTAVYVVLVPFFSWIFLSKKPFFRNYVGAVICMIGIAFVALVGKNEHGNREFLGDILSLASGIFYAFQIIYIAKHAENEDAIQLLIIEILTVAVLCICVTGALEFPLHYQEFSIPQGFVWKILYLALVCTLFAQFGQMIAQKYTPATSVAILFSFEAVFGVIFELIFGNAQITVYLIVGFVLIFVSEIVSEIGVKKLFSSLNKNRSREKLCNKEEQN